MAFREPFAAYNAENNIEAHIVCGILNDSGIEAMVIEDISFAGGIWWGGTVSELHKPQVWIERADCDRAKPVLDDYEQRAADRREAEEFIDDDDELVDAECEKCGTLSFFPASQNGTIQNCPHCKAYVDVGTTPELEGWDDVPGEEQEAG